MSQAGNTQEIRSLTGATRCGGHLCGDLFLGRRIARVYPLYLAATLWAAMLVACGWLDWLSGQPLRIAIPLNVAMVQAWGFGQSLDSPGWSISAEWAAYLLFPFALRLVYYGLLKRATLSAVASVALILALCANSSSYPSKRPAIVLLAAQSRTDFLVVLLFPPLILSLTSQNSLPSQLLSGKLAHHFGKLSYSIYLVDDLFGGLLARIHNAANLHGLHHGQSVGIAVILPLIYVLALVACYGIERPERKLLRNLFEGKTQQSPRGSSPLQSELLGPS